MTSYSPDILLPNLSAEGLKVKAWRILGNIVRVLVLNVEQTDQYECVSESSSMECDLEDIYQSRKGDSDAYRRLVEKYQEHVGHILWRFSRDRLIHEELVQDVFVEAYLSLKSYSAKAPFPHWLARIATRVGYRYWKQKARVQETEPLRLEEWDMVASSSEDRIETAEAAELVHNLMEQLPPRDRLVLMLRLVEGCDVAETAQRTGWTKTMVKVQSLRARKKLKALFEKNWSDTDDRF